jgi:integrase
MKKITKVSLREKPIKDNRKSLYLDFYPAIQHPDTGKQTRREFLGLYIMDKPKMTKEEKEIREATRYKGRLIAATRELKIQSGQYGFLSSVKQNTDFVSYFEDLADKRKASNKDNWVSTLHYVKAFTGGKLKFSDVNEQWCNKFKDYLLTTPTNRSTKTTLSQNSCVSYFNKLKATLTQAYKDGYLLTDLNAKIDCIKAAETDRAYLTIEEIQALIGAECPMPMLRQAALFSTLTGLRFSDIEKMTWSEVKYTENDGHYLQFQQRKTKGFEVLPMSEQAYNLLGDRANDTDKVFDGLTYSAWTNANLTKWVANAGIKKHITFHSFRHTFATLQMSLGTDLYTVSKMLGHKDLKTTQIYAKIVDKSKRAAADKIKLDM